MRLVIAAAALALASLGAASAAAQGSPVPVLNPGEVLLEVDADGTARAPADNILVKVPITAKGATAAEARAANEALAARLLAAVRAAGVDEDDVRLLPPASSAFAFVGNEAMEALLTRQSPEEPQIVVNTIEIRLRDPRRFTALRQALEAAGAERVSDPQYRLIDDREPRRAAKADAVRRAREEAEAYARTLGMSVGRILRVSERVNLTYSQDGMEDIYRRMIGFADLRSSDVETRVRVSVDFALTPRR